MNRMNVTLTAVFAGCAVVTLSSQAANTQGTNQAQDLKRNSVTIAGCVADEAGHYMLTHAMIKPSTPATTGTAGSTPTPADTPSTAHADTRGTMYDLKGDADLKPHVGHKVEVTGTSSPAIMADERSTAAPADAHAVLTVTSVKMLSTTCP